MRVCFEFWFHHVAVFGFAVPPLASQFHPPRHPMEFPMSTGVILTVLSNIPWGQLVENAPKLADGAAKLWSTVTGFRKPPLPAAETPGSAGNDPPSEAAAPR